MPTRKNTSGYKHVRDSPIADGRESFIDLYFGIIPFVQRSLQFLQSIIIHFNSPVACFTVGACKGRHQSDVAKILARAICCQNENEAVVINRTPVFTGQPIKPGA